MQSDLRFPWDLAIAQNLPGHEPTFKRKLFARHAFAMHRLFEPHKTLKSLRRPLCVRTHLDMVQVQFQQGGSEHFWIALPNKDHPDLL